MTIVVMAHFEALDACREVLQRYLTSMRDLSRIEDGCISYEVFADTRNPRAFFVMEVWRDEVARQGHINTKRVDAFREDIPPMLKVPYTVSLLSKLP